MPRVFISRNLSDDSLFLQCMQNAGFKVIGESLINFSLVPFDHVPEADWIFFYSKKSVRFFFSHVRQAGLPLQAKIAALGSGTATALQDWQVQADFIGSGEPESTATAFLKIANRQRVLFPRAQHSRQSIQQTLGKKIEAIDLIVYQNDVRTDFELPPCAWLVFTSPLNVQAYIRKYAIRAEQQVLAIGNTTAQALSEAGIMQVKIADAPSEAALAQAILNN